jgi:hypothetical protein
MSEHDEQEQAALVAENQRLRAALALYARHLPTCLVYGPCSCGLGALLAEMEARR